MKYKRGEVNKFIGVKKEKRLEEQLRLVLLYIVLNLSLMMISLILSLIYVLIMYIKVGRVASFMFV